MPDDIIERVDKYISGDETKWAKLSSTVQYRAMELSLLREILVEIRKLNRTLESRHPTGGEPVK